MSNKNLIAKKRRCTGKTIGTVIRAERTYHEILHQGDDDGRHDHLNYSYTLEYKVEGHTYRLNGTSFYSWVGEKKKVYYNPANPQECEIGGMGLAIWVNYFTIVFFAFAIIIIIQFVILRAPDGEDDIENEEDYEYEFDIDEEIDDETEYDEETLQLFEEWFRNAEYIIGSADCGNQNACLELVLANGETVRLSVATDSCATFGINGVYYDYSPTDHWDSREFFEHFDEIPWNWDVNYE